MKFSTEFESMGMEESGEYTRMDKKYDGKLKLVALMTAVGVFILIVMLFVLFCYQQRKLADLEHSVRNVNCSVNLEMNAGSQKDVLAEMNSSVMKLTSSVNDISSKLQNTDEQVMKLLLDLNDLNIKLQKRNKTIPLCKSGWIQFQSKCYFFSRDLLTWYKARDFCRNESGILVKVETEEELNFLTLQPIQYWVGLTDETTGHWRWDDGTPLVRNSNLWAEGQPDNWDGHGLEGGEDCGHLRAKGKLNDIHCSAEMQFICQI